MKKNSTYIIALIISLAIVGWGLILPASFEAVGNKLFATFVTNFGWFYSLSMTAFVGFVIWIGLFSKYRNLRLGPDDSKPEYSNISWFAMLFSAGMGIGLVFWGTAEPLNFFAAPLGAEPGTAEAAEFAMNKAFLHWGLHPWANYSVLALALAYMQFRKNKPGLISSVFIPVLGTGPPAPATPRVSTAGPHRLWCGVAPSRGGHPRPPGSPPCAGRTLGRRNQPASSSP